MTEQPVHYKTKGFWITLATFTVSGLVLTGVLAPDEEGKMGMIAHHVIESISLVTTVTAGYLYGKSRDNQRTKEAISKLPAPPRKRKTREPRKTKPRS